MNVDAATQREEAFAQIVSEVHRQVEATSSSEMARSLKAVLSTQLLAYISGKSARTVQRWARGDVAGIRPESNRRLVTAYEILQLIDRFEAPGVAATWFVGRDPQLDFIMPATALREGQLEKALAAARYFVAVG